jgi:hypothetical protein
VEALHQHEILGQEKRRSLAAEMGSLELTCFFLNIGFHLEYALDCDYLLTEDDKHESCTQPANGMYPSSE